MNAVNGYVDVEFHVKGDLCDYSKEYIQKVIETVAVILDCKDEDILLNGIRLSTSFLLSFAVKVVYIRKILVMKLEDHIKLIRLNIDKMIVDMNTIDLERPKGK